MRISRIAPSLTVGLVSVAVTAPSAGASPTPPAFGVAPTIDHYTQGPNGTTQTTTAASGAQGAAPFNALAASTLPFDYTVDYDSTLRGRDMRTSSGNFCLSYRADSVANAAATPYIRVTLRKNNSPGIDGTLETHTFNNDYGRHDQCWPHHDGAATYHFDFGMPGGTTGYNVKGHGTAYSG